MGSVSLKAIVALIKLSKPDDFSQSEKAVVKRFRLLRDFFPGVFCAAFSFFCQYGADDLQNSKYALKLISELIIAVFSEEIHGDVFSKSVLCESINEKISRLKEITLGTSEKVIKEVKREDKEVEDLRELSRNLEMRLLVLFSSENPHLKNWRIRELLVFCGGDILSSCFHVVTSGTRICLVTFISIFFDDDFQAVKKASENLILHKNIIRDDLIVIEELTASLIVILKHIPLKLKKEEIEAKMIMLSQTRGIIKTLAFIDPNRIETLFLLSFDIVSEALSCLFTVRSVAHVSYPEECTEHFPASSSLLKNSHVSFYENRFHHFVEESEMKSLFKLTDLIGEFFTETTLMRLFDLFLSKYCDSNESVHIIIINKIVTGAVKKSTFSEIFKLYIKNLAKQYVKFLGESANAKNKIILELGVSSILKGFSAFSHILNCEFRSLLEDILCPVLNQMASSSYLVRHSALALLRQISINCGYENLDSLLLNYSRTILDFLSVEMVWATINDSQLICDLLSIKELTKTIVPYLHCVFDRIFIHFSENLSDLTRFPEKKFINNYIKIILGINMAVFFNKHGVEYNMSHHSFGEDFKVGDRFKKSKEENANVSKEKSSLESLEIDEKYKNLTTLLNEFDSRREADFDPASSICMNNCSDIFAKKQIEIKSDQLDIFVHKTVMNSLPFLSSNSFYTKNLVLEVIKVSLENLSSSDDFLLPAIADIWVYLKPRFEDKNLITVIKSFETLYKMISYSGMFLRRRFENELWPVLKNVLKEYKVSNNARSKGHKTTLHFRLGKEILFCVCAILDFPGFASLQSIKEVIKNCFPSMAENCLKFLSQNFYEELHEEVLRLFRKMILVDSNRVDEVLIKFKAEADFFDYVKEYRKNFEELFNIIKVNGEPVV